MQPASIHQPFLPGIHSYPSGHSYRIVLPVSTGFMHSIKTSCLSQGVPEEIIGKIPEDAFIPMAFFMANDRMEDTLSRWIQRICQMLGGFSLSFNNFGAISSEGVFLRIQDQQEIKKGLSAFRPLDVYLNGNDFPSISTENRFMLPLANDQTPDFSNQLANWLAPCEFHGKVKIESLLLQRRNGKRWKTVQQFYFMPITQPFLND